MFGHKDAGDVRGLEEVFRSEEFGRRTGNAGGDVAAPPMGPEDVLFAQEFGRPRTVVRLHDPSDVTDPTLTPTGEALRGGAGLATPGSRSLARRPILPTAAQRWAMRMPKLIAGFVESTQHPLLDARLRQRTRGTRRGRRHRRVGIIAPAVDRRPGSTRAVRPRQGPHTGTDDDRPDGAGPAHGGGVAPARPCAGSWHRRDVDSVEQCARRARVVQSARRRTPVRRRLDLRRLAGGVGGRWRRSPSPGGGSNPVAPTSHAGREHGERLGSSVTTAASQVGSSVPAAASTDGGGQQRRHRQSTRRSARSTL